MQLLKKKCDMFHTSEYLVIYFSYLVDKSIFKFYNSPDACIMYVQEENCSRLN